jgi:hypothetical protein
VRLPNGRFGSKASTGASEDGHVDVYELQWSPQLVQSLTSPSIKISDPGEGESLAFSHSSSLPFVIHFFI